MTVSDTIEAYVAIKDAKLTGISPNSRKAIVKSATAMQKVVEAWQEFSKTVNQQYRNLIPEDMQKDMERFDKLPMERKVAITSIKQKQTEEMEEILADELAKEISGKIEVPKDAIEEIIENNDFTVAQVLALNKLYV